MLKVIKNGRWFSSWPLKDVTLKHVKDYYESCGYVIKMIGETIHLIRPEKDDG